MIINLVLTCLLSTLMNFLKIKEANNCPEDELHVQADSSLMSKDETLEAQQLVIDRLEKQVKEQIKVQSKIIAATEMANFRVQQMEKETKKFEKIFENGYKAFDEMNENSEKYRDIIEQLETFISGGRRCYREFLNEKDDEIDELTNELNYFKMKLNVDDTYINETYINHLAVCLYIGE